MPTFKRIPRPSFPDACGFLGVVPNPVGEMTRGRVCRKNSLSLTVDAWFLAHVLPTAAIEDASGWKDRALVGLPVVFDKVVIIDRCEQIRGCAGLT